MATEDNPTPKTTVSNGPSPGSLGAELDAFEKAFEGLVSAAERRAKYNRELADFGAANGGAGPLAGTASWAENCVAPERLARLGLMAELIVLSLGGNPFAQEEFDEVSENLWLWQVLKQQRESRGVKTAARRIVVHMCNATLDYLRRDYPISAIAGPLKRKLTHVDPAFDGVTPAMLESILSRFNLRPAKARQRSGAAGGHGQKSAGKALAKELSCACGAFGYRDTPKDQQRALKDFGRC